MEGKQREWLVIGIALFIVILVGALAWYEKYQVASVSMGPTPVFAATGQLTPGFPQGLVLNGNATVKQSYAITYAGSVGQYTTQWDSNSPITDIFSNYLSYFQKNGWTIMNQTSNNPTVRGIYATSGSSSVNIAIMSITNGSRVTVSYLKK